MKRSRFTETQIISILKYPEAEVLFDLGKPRYTPSGIPREHMLAILVTCPHERVHPLS